jgi:hypothetical protein
MSKLDYRDVVITETLNDRTEAEEVIVVVGDGKTVFDENYDFDARVYFYFDNEQQFELAKTEIQEFVGFQILEVKED